MVSGHEFLCGPEEPIKKWIQDHVDKSDESTKIILFVFFILKRIKCCREIRIRLCFCSIVNKCGQHCAHGFLKSKTSFKICLPNERRLEISQSYILSY